MAIPPFSLLALQGWGSKSDLDAWVACLDLMAAPGLQLFGTQHLCQKELGVREACG